MVSPSYFPVKGGAETVVQNLSASLNERGVHTDVMTFNMERRWVPRWQGETRVIDGVSVFRIPALNWLPLTHSNRLTLGVNLVPGRFTNVLRNYDIIHFHEFELSFPLFSSLVKRPKIIHFHGMDVNFLKRYTLSRTLLKLLANSYISISEKMTRDLLALGFDNEKIICLPNGVDSSLFKPQGQKEDNLLLYVGRINPRKGLHILLRSLSHLEKPIRLAIIGPMDSGGAYRQEIVNLIEKERTRRKHEIIYLGTMNNDEVVSWYQKASLFILPSFSEGFPMTIIEALSCETPVIASPVGGIPEVVKEHETGILVRPGRPDTLALAIQYLLENADVRMRLGREGRKRVIRYYSLDCSVGKLCNFYRKLCS